MSRKNVHVLIKKTMLLEDGANRLVWQFSSICKKKMQQLWSTKMWSAVKGGT